MLNAQLKIENGTDTFNASRDNSETYLVYVKPDQVNSAISLSLPLIKQSLSDDSAYSIEDVIDELRSARAQLWHVMRGQNIQAIVVTVINTHPCAKDCMIWLCAGKDRKDWIHLLAQIEDWAKAHGCDAMIVRGRTGWEKVMKDYKKTHIILEKKLR